MKLHADRPTSLSVTAYGDDWIKVNNEVLRHSVVLPEGGHPTPWPCARFDDLTPAHFEQLLSWRPELVIFGSGSKLRFAHPSMYRALIEAGVGVETMSTQAACRTFNVLTQEGRRVVAALLLESA